MKMTGYCENYKNREHHFKLKIGIKIAYRDTNVRYFNIRYVILRVVIKMSKKIDKTNVMRILDQKKIAYNYKTYDKTIRNANLVASSLQQDPTIIFKTLVTVGKSKEYYVFMVPSEKELDLKKAAKITKEKSLEMILQKELLPLTGYVHGGCSPIGMKKQYKTWVDRTAENLPLLGFSGGRVGYQVQMPLSELQKVIPVALADITKDR